MNLEEFLNQKETKQILAKSQNPTKALDELIFERDFTYEEKKEWLRRFIHREFGIWIPNKSVCENHCSPMDFIADVFFQKVQSALAVANRDGGKTFDFAILHALHSRFYDGCETASIGAVEEQAKKCYSYFKQFIKAPAFKEIYRDPLIMETALKNGSKVKIAPGTINALNSPHPHKSFFDEVELTKWDILQEFFSMSKSEKNIGIKATDVLGSTRKYAYGVIQQLLDEIQSGNMPGFKIYMWCIWEVTEPFELKEEWKDIIKPTKDGHISFYDIAKKYAGRTNGFYPIDDLVKKFSSMSYDTFQTQWACEKPSKEGLVYGNEFDEADILPERYIPKAGLPIYFAQDFGYNDPMASLFGHLQDDGKTIVLFNEFYVNKISASRFAKTYLIPRKVKWGKNLICGLHDPAGKGSAREMKEAKDEEGRKIGALIPMPTGIEEGVQLVKSLHEAHRIKISPDLHNYLREKRSYHYLPGTDKPADEDNHLMDDERYLMKYLFGEKEEDKKRKHWGMPAGVASKNRVE